MALRKTTLSIQTFEKIIDENRIYLDKTHLLFHLISSDITACFFSRPRRFGKSLTVSTLDAIFSGKKYLFETLAISKTDYEWPVHPVIRLDMKHAAHPNLEDTKRGLNNMLRRIGTTYKVSFAEELTEDLFFTLIQKLYEKTGQKVVILIDEYDKPLIDRLSDIQEARKIQEFLKTFYGVLKSADEFIRFVFITGVSKFTKVSLFSDLNHLTDLTMHPTYATLVGITEAELVDNYSAHLEKIAADKGWEPERVMDEMRRWYNGYRFSKNPVKVYNPWSTLTCLSTGDFQEHWYTTGVPKMLVDIINRDKESFVVMDPADFDLTQAFEYRQFDAYDIETLQLIPLMVQTGFLTLKDYDETRETFTLGYPNWEVRKAFSAMIVESRLQEHYTFSPRITALDIKDALKQKNISELIAILNSLIASIPGNLHTPKESYYHSLIHMVFQMSGLSIRSEEWVAGGRMDTVIEEPDCFYIIELKFGATAKDALDQIKTRKYSKKFERGSKPIKALGIGVECATKSISDWVLEDIA